MNLVPTLILLGCLAAAAQTAVQIARPGSFRGRLPTLRTSGGWIGLAPSRDGFAWRSYRLKVTFAAGETHLTHDGGEQPLVLLRGLPSLAAKPVHTCFDRSEGGSLHEQNPILLTCEARAFRLEAGPRRPTELRLEHAGKRQVLYRWPNGLTDQRAEVVWVGDLDGDDRLDLLLDHADTAGTGNLTLYLSTWAPKGQMVGRVASFRSRDVEVKHEQD